MDSVSKGLMGAMPPPRILGLGPPLGKRLVQIDHMYRKPYESYDHVTDDVTCPK